MEKSSFKDLNNKVCVITGGAGVICSSIAKGLGYVGVKTALLDKNKEMAINVAADIEKETGTASKGYFADVLDTESLEVAKEKIKNTKTIK